jgi:hypothetical protein
MAEIDLTFPGRQIERLMDDNRVLTAMVMRVDGSLFRLEISQAELMAEMRAMHAKITRIDDRVSKLEEARA